MRKGIAYIVLILVVLSVLFAAAGCGSAQAPAQPQEIRIGVLGATTGPTAASVLPMVQEAEYFLRYINEVEGGINGVKLSWRVMDTKGAPDGAVIAYKEMRDTFKPIIYYAVEDFIYTGILDMIKEDKSVFITAAALDNKLYTPTGRFFSAAIAGADGFGGYMKYVADNWKGPGKPKVGVLHWDRASGLQWKLAEPWVKKLGVELVSASYPMTTMDLKPQLLSLRDAGVNQIWVLGIANYLSLAIRDVRALDIYGKIPVTFNEFSEGDAVLRVAGAAAEGFYDYRSESPYSDNTPAARTYTAVWKFAKGEDKWAENRIVYTVQATIKAAVKQAVADVGWGKLNSEAIYNALNKLTSIDTDGNMKDFGFGPDKRVGVSAIKIKKFTATGLVAASDWIKLPRIFEGIDK